MEIKVKKCSIVQPAKDTPKHTLRSSNLDLLVSRFHVQTVYFYKQQQQPYGTSPNFFDPHLLKEALSNCLVAFYPAAGRLTRGGGGGGRFEIDCNGEGVLFVEAESEAVIDDFGDFTLCSELQLLVPTVDYTDKKFSYPLVVLQVTNFKCGGVSLGVGVHHTLADGKSALHFINAWSDMTRGVTITIPPLIDRSLLHARDPPSPTFHHTEYDPPPSMNTPVQTREYQSSPKLTSTAILKITLDELNKLKSNSKNKKDPKRYSTYETLAAHVWRCTCTARGLGDDQATKLYITTDGRSRLHPPLPPGYLGNVLFTATSVALSGEITSQPLTSIVERVHDALSRMDDDYLRSALDYLALQPDPTALIRGAHTFKCPNLNVVSWFRLPVHDADFGWGRPIHMGPTKVPFEGNCYILPSPTGDGSLSLVICLEEDHLKVFKTVFYEF